jgi:hypothetical protein
MAWIVETLNVTADSEVNALPADLRAQLSRASFLIEEFGLESDRRRAEKRSAFRHAQCAGGRSPRRLTAAARVVLPRCAVGTVSGEGPPTPRRAFQLGGMNRCTTA